MFTLVGIGLTDMPKYGDVNSKWALVGDMATSQYHPVPNPVFSLARLYLIGIKNYSLASA